MPDQLRPVSFRCDCPCIEILLNGARIFKRDGDKDIFDLYLLESIGRGAHDGACTKTQNMWDSVGIILKGWMVKVFLNLVRWMCPGAMMG